MSDIRLKMFVLTASYSREEDGVVVDVFGKTPDNRSVVARFYGFKPYFYLVEPPEEILKKFREDPEIIKLEGVELWHKGRKRNCVKVIMHSPWKTPRYREEAKKYCEVLAADIPFHHRFMYDVDMGSCIEVWGKRREDLKDRFTTDIILDAEGFRNIEKFSPKLRIMSFDIENSMESGSPGRILVIGYTVRWEDGRLEKGAIVDDEEKIILKKFLELIRRIDPDVITGYNIDGYDLEVLSDAYKNYGIDFSIGRDFSKPQRIAGQFWRVHGRIILDAWWAVKMEIKPKQETLAAVAKELLGESKIDVDRLRIDEEWRKNRDKVIEYCIKDAELALKIIEKITILDKKMALAYVSKLPLADVVHGGTSQLVDSLLIREADRNGIGVPLSGSLEKSRKIEGGYVHDIGAGLYHWVCVLDFKSMYPSIIIKYNICFTTLDEKGEIVAPNGVRFTKSREGLIPKILKNLMTTRDEFKRKMKEARTPEEREYYDSLQNAVKILMNTFYGVLASSFYRFTNPEIGASITAFARETIKKIIKEIESRGIRVIYGDTDSIFFESLYDNLEDTVKLGKRIAEEISKKENLLLEFEKVFEPFFSHGAKKRYVGRVVYPEEERDKIVVRGYEIRRTDSFDLQSEAQQMVFEKILEGDLEGAIKLSKEIVEKVRRGEVEIEKLVISRTVRNLSSYKNPERMANVQAAKKLIKMGYEFVPGMKVSWIVVNGRRTPQVVEPYIPGREFTKKPDYEYYAERIAATLSRITDSLGLDQSYLITGKKQKTIWDLIEKKEKKKKKKSGKITLEDFF